MKQKSRSRKSHVIGKGKHYTNLQFCQMMYISLIVCLIKSLQRLLETTAQRLQNWSICVSHGSALTKIRWNGKWVHFA